MSAWMVSHTHINALLTAWESLNRRDPYAEEAGNDVATQVGKMLLAENVKSLKYRYEDRHPDMYDEEADAAFVFSPLPGFNPDYPSHLAIVAKSINCYRYQSCEHPGWETSDAYKFCAELDDDLLRALRAGLPRNVGWGINDRDVFQEVS